MKLIRPLAINDAALVSSSIAEDDYTPYNAGTTYTIGDRVRVVASDVHLVYEALQSANTGNTPATSPTWWVEVGATNRWAMFDASNTSQTTAAESITITLIAAGRIDSVALLNLSAASARIVQSDVTDGVVYDKTFDLTSSGGITDWYRYFMEPIIRKSELVVSDLLPYANSTITITINSPAGISACGACVLGLSRDIGTSQAGARVGIDDYSLKTRDQFGTYSIVERSFSKRCSFDIVIYAEMVDEARRILAEYRATPIVYIGSNSYSSAVVFGFYKDFSIVIQYASFSICSIEIEGLT